jgi:hypothetical protein
VAHEARRQRRQQAARLDKLAGQPAGGDQAALPLAYHPLYRFYEGGSLTRRFRGLPERPDDWWSEDWVGSCTCANNPDPGGRGQGLSLHARPMREWARGHLGSRFGKTEASSFLGTPGRRRRPGLCGHRLRARHRP